MRGRGLRRGGGGCEVAESVLCRRIVSYASALPAGFDESQLISISEAAKRLGLTMPGVIRMIERGGLTEYAYCSSSHTPIRRPGNRFVLASEVAEIAGVVHENAEERRHRAALLARGLKPL